MFQHIANNATSINFILFFANVMQKLIWWKTLLYKMQIIPDFELINTGANNVFR